MHVVLAETPSERPATDAEDPCGLPLIPADLLQHPLDVTSLDCAQRSEGRLVRRLGRFGGARLFTGRETVHLKAPLCCCCPSSFTAKPTGGFAHSAHDPVARNPTLAHTGVESVA